MTQYDNAYDDDFGFSTPEAPNKRYAAFHENKIVIRHKQPLDGVAYIAPPKPGESDVLYNKAVYRTRLVTNPKTGETKTIHEEAHGSFTGYLVGMRLNDGDFGKQWEYHFELPGKDETIVINTSYSGPYARNLNNRLCNVEPAHLQGSKMTIAPYCFDGEFIGTDGKPVKIKGVTLMVGDDRMKIEQAFTKESDPPLPAPVKVMVNDQEMTDRKDQLLFLNQHLVESVVPHLSGNLKGKVQLGLTQSKTPSLLEGPRPDGDPLRVDPADITADDVPF